MEKSNVRMYAFDGIDGCGKTTLIAKLSKHYQQLGYSVFEMGASKPSTTHARMLRDKLFDFPKAAVQHCFAAIALDNIEIIKRIYATAELPTIILQDRYLFSAIAYSQANGGWQAVKSYKKQLSDADISFFLQIDPAAAMRRTQNQPTHQDDYDQNERMLRAVDWNFKLKCHPKVTIRAEQEPQNVFNDVVEYIDQDLRFSRLRGIINHAK